jgi:hypothetical protein
MAVITAGVAALGPEAVARIVKTIKVYDDFVTPTTRTKKPPTRQPPDPNVTSA